VAALATHGAVLANMEGLVAPYQAQGYERAQRGDLQAAVLDPGLGLDNVLWTIELRRRVAKQVFRKTQEMIDPDARWPISCPRCTRRAASVFCARVE